MRIALLITRLDSSGGAQSHVWTLARGLAELGEDVILIHGGQHSAPALDEARRPNLRVMALPSLQRAVSPVGDVRATAALWRLLKRLAPDVLHAHSTKAGLLGCLAGRLGRTATAFTAHGWSAIMAAPGAAVGRKLAIAAHRLGLASVDRVVVLSKHDEAFALRHRMVPARTLHRLPLGIVDTPLRAAPQAEPSRLVTVARHAWPKDAETLLGALHLCRDLPWTLHWLGGGPQLKATRRRIEALGLQGRISALGEVPDAADALSRATAFLLSSRAEGLPLSVLEAMRAGLPVVASDVGGVREAVGEAGWLVPPGDAQAFASALRKVLCAPEERLARGKLGRARFEATGAVAPMIRGHRALYRALCGGSTTEDEAGR